MKRSMSCKNASAVYPGNFEDPISRLDDDLRLPRSKNVCVHDAGHQAERRTIGSGRQSSLAQILSASETSNLIQHQHKDGASSVGQISGAIPVHDIPLPDSPQPRPPKRVRAIDDDLGITKRTRRPLALSARRHQSLGLGPLPRPTSSPTSALQPQSPLFFSNSPHARPMLPARYSSSEASATMLNRTRQEDSNVKTISLPRGVAPPLISYPTHSSSGRSSMPPDDLHDHEHENDDTHPDLFGSIGIVELLDQDERPTLIVDVGDKAQHEPGTLQTLFVNPALRSDPDLLDRVRGTPLGIQSSADNDGIAFEHFKSWLFSEVRSSPSAGTTHDFANTRWSHSTLRGRYRVVSGVVRGVMPRLPRKEPIRSDHTVVAAALTPESTRSRLHMQNEPDDYFGELELPPRQTDAVTMTGAQRRKDSTSGSRVSEHRSIVSSVEGVQQLATRHQIEDSALTQNNSCFDWTRIPVTDDTPKHIRFAKSVDWAATSLGPISEWTADLRQMCNLIMASPHPAAMYWGPDYIAIYNEAYVPLAGQKHPTLMGQPYSEAWAEIWEEIEDVFASARLTGEATSKDDDCLYVRRNDFLEETYFSWSICPIVGTDGSVTGLYNPCFEKTRRKIAERRMLTLREVGERTASARDLSSFWAEVLAALNINEHDTPLALLYSVTDESDSDASSTNSATHSGSILCTLEGSLGVAEDHAAAIPSIDLRTGTEGFGPAFREVMNENKPVLLEIGSENVPHALLEGTERRGFTDPCTAVVICPIHPTTGDDTLGFLVLGVNPRRPYDEDYSLFVQLLSRQLATSLASVVLFEEEIKRGQRAARLAALDRIELSAQLAARTQEAIESETKFTRMAEFAPVGMFIADHEGKITYSNDTWFEISRLSKDATGLTEKWMDAIADEDKEMVSLVWQDLLTKRKPSTSTFRFKAPWQDEKGSAAERWVLFSAYPERYANGELKSVFGSFTDISKQKWAEGFQKRKMEEAVELKRQQENFIDMTSHEMRNPLSAILQCADEVTTTMTQLKDMFDGDAASTGSQDTSHLVESISGTIEAAQTIALCAQHQKRIVDDILTLSKLDSQLLLVTPVAAQPLNVVQRVLKMHEGELHSHGIELKFHVDESFSALGIDWVKFDPSRVLQVLINLTTNAIKFTTSEKERTITVAIAASLERPSTLPNQSVNYVPSRRPERALSREDSEWGAGQSVYIYFGVEDTGRGLTDEEKKLLFLRFSQASPRTHVQYGGSGLGLFIARELTELQGGEIGVASEAGKGSTFAFYVEAKRTKEPEQGSLDASVVTKASATGTGGSAPTKHILLVEDNLVNQRVLQKQLTNMGCTVYVANHGREALDKLRETVYWCGEPTTQAPRLPLSVVLMDQEMPIMDGLTATRKIREMEEAGQFRCHVPVIAVTANARSEQVTTALTAGMDDVVAKPFRLSELIPKIEELMNRYPEPKIA